ncbi:MAG: S8 family serine peptidase [Gemmatimonadales bacterium]|nr:S8 family serine peptidase [Gemmatimonadales bacterium]
MITEQGYLADAPQGIGVNSVAVWGDDFDGTGIGFIDLERGWTLAHQDLPRAVTQPQPMFNVNDPSDPDHGTAVLGIVLGRPGGAAGVNGIAPNATFLGVVSRTAAVNVDEWDVVAAIAAAMDSLQAGDVLLIEVEMATGYPVEVDDAILTALRLSAGNDIIVVEAAGNGTGFKGRDLDKVLRKTAASASENNRLKGYPVREADRTLDRDNGGALFIDSGAILVSSCRSSVTSGHTHRRTGSGGFGSRVDCYAWGDGVATAGYGDYVGSAQAKNKRYTDTFNGTSAAAAIIAGAAILVQQMAERLTARRLTPTAMRALLSTAKGTDVIGTQDSKKIGVMPDLAALATHLSGA